VGAALFGCAVNHSAAHAIVSLLPVVCDLRVRARSTDCPIFVSKAAHGCGWGSRFSGATRSKDIFAWASGPDCVRRGIDSQREMSRTRGTSHLDATGSPGV
jgi:hypothetical protein